MSKPNHTTVFFDLDGVLADFDGHLDAHGYRAADGNAQWDKLDVSWWASMPACVGAKDFFTKVSARAQTRFLTAPTKSVDCFAGKAQWVTTFLPEMGPMALMRLIIAPSFDKAFIAGPNRILIDDRQKNIDEWVAAGGIGILHSGDFAKTWEKLAPHLPAQRAAFKPKP